MNKVTDLIAPSFIPPTMPPLLQEEKVILADPNYSGISCQSFVMGYLTMNQINVAEPKVDTGVDLLVEKQPKIWLNAQIKKVVLRQDTTNTDGEIKDRFQLTFQNTQQNLSTEKIDLYYHVLLTHQRVMIWEVDAQYVPIREDGFFVKNTNIVIDRHKRSHYETDFQKNLKLVYVMYSPQVYVNNQSFFV